MTITTHRHLFVPGFSAQCLSGQKYARDVNEKLKRKLQNVFNFLSPLKVYGYTDTFPLHFTDQMGYAFSGFLFASLYEAKRKKGQGALVKKMKRM